MITNKLLIKLTISLFLCVSVFPSFGQQTYIKDRLNLKITNARYHSGWLLKENSEKKIRTGKYRIEGNYGFFNSIEVGMYLGFYVFTNYEIVGTELFAAKKYIIPNYGINANWHIFPYFIKNDDFRFDLYVTTKIGGEYYTIPGPSTFLDRHFTEISLGSGFAFYLTKHIGLFAECGFYVIPKTEKTSDLDNFLLSYGLSFKFKK